MGRFRTISNQRETQNSSEFNKKRSGLARLKYARSIIDTDKKTNNFSLCCNRIVTFQDYNSLIDLHKIQASVEPNCYECADVPVTLHNGLESEICYNEYFKTINELKNHPCKCINLHKINLCKEEKGKMFPYGHFNNNNPSLHYNLHRKLILCCQERKPCPVYIFCKCPPDTQDCKCCDYSVTFPFQDKFLHYTVSGCNDAKEYDDANNPMHNPAKTYNKYLAQKTANEIIEDISTLDFSKFESEFF